jgi:hypothetical protein
MNIFSGGPKPTVTNLGAAIVSPPKEGKSAFGEALVAELFPVSLLDLSKGINPILVKTRGNAGGSVTHANNMGQIATGAGTNRGALVGTNDNVRYEPGVGVRARFTAIFDDAVDGNVQAIGIGNSGDGLFFGYNGTTFGILHRRYGNDEVRTLTISTKSSTVENITITLDGVAASVPVTNGADKTVTANEIAAFDYSNIGEGWDANAVGDRVVFISWAAKPHSGAYSLSGASTAVGTFAQDLAGVSPTETWHDQSDWNGADKFDGSGETGIDIDFTTGNVFQIAYQWLGFGPMSFFVQDPTDGEFHLVHQIFWGNGNPRPSMGNPSLPMSAFVRNTTNATDIVLQTGSMGAFHDGKDELIGIRRGVEGSVVLTGVAVETPVLALRCKELFLGAVNRGQIKVQLVGVSVEHTKPVDIKFYANPTLVGATFTDVDTAGSMMEEAVGSNRPTSFSGGVFLFSLPLGKSSNDTINLTADKFAGVFNPGSVILATAAPLSGNGAEATVSFNLAELT